MIAVYYIIRMGLAIKQILYPVYDAQVMDKNMRYVLLYFGLHQSSDNADDDLSLSIKVQYLGLLFTAFLIVTNVQSFLRKLLVTLKYILRDNEIQFSFQTTLLLFSFVMGSYYLSILLQMSMNLPEARRKPF